MLAKVQKWGNSLALRIPRTVANDTQLDAESVVDLSVNRGRLVITPSRRRKVALVDLLSRIKRSHLHQDVDFGPPKGREKL